MLAGRRLIRRLLQTIPTHILARPVFLQRYPFTFIMRRERVSDRLEE